MNTYEDLEQIIDSEYEAEFKEITAITSDAQANRLIGIIKNNKEEISEKHKKYNNQLCIDPTNGTKCTYSALKWRKKRHAEKYKDIIPQNCIIDKKSIIS